MTTLRRFFVDRKEIVKGSTFTLSESESYHCYKVLRLRNGERVALFNGSGAEYDAEIICADRTATRVRAINRRYPVTESRMQIALAVSLLKGPKMDLVIEKAVELGAACFTPFFPARTVVKKESDARIEGKVRRWERIIQAASKQCGRVRLMSIHPPSSLEATMNMFLKYDLKLVAVERKEVLLLSNVLNQKKAGNLHNIVIIIGPEGGWESDELALFTNAGVEFVSLGKRVLRSETAAIASLSLLMSWAGEL